LAFSGSGVFGVVAVACLVASSTSLHLDLGLVVAVVK